MSHRDHDRQSLDAYIAAKESMKEEIYAGGVMHFCSAHDVSSPKASHYLFERSSILVYRQD
jgi:hypothetical protein